MEKLKKCNKCLIEKPATNEFFNYKYKKKNDTLNTKCKTCEKEYQRKHYAIHKRERIDYLKNYSKNLLPKYKAYERSAKCRKIEFAVTFEEFKTFWQENCYYCNSIIENIGIDRVDSTKNYTLDNVVSCCAKCNYMKRNYTLTEFISHISKIYKNLQFKLVRQKMVEAEVS